jgi:hypothetical protein
MPKYLVETVSVFRMRYVVEAKNASDARNEVTMNVGDNFHEFSQLHLDEMITSTREIDNTEYLRMFDEDNEKYYRTYDTSKFLRYTIQYVLHWADYMSTIIERQQLLG